MMLNAIQKRLWLNAALILLVIALGLLLWLEPGKKTGQENIISTLDKTSVTKILIETGNRPPVRIEKQQSDWRMIEPVGIAANHFRIASILNLLNTPSISRYATEGLDLAEFGLSPPRATIYFDDLPFSFGDTDPVKRYRYLLGGDTLFLIADMAYPLISANIGGLVNPRLLPENETISTFELPGFTLTRQANGGWFISPENKSLTADDLQAWADEWLNAQSTYIEYLPNKTIDHGDTVVITLQSGKTIPYRIIHDETETALFRDGLKLKYTVNAPLLDRLIDFPRSKSTNHEEHEVHEE